MQRFITSVFIADRVGILRDVTQVVFALEGNIGSIRQTVVDGFFTLVFTSEHPATSSRDALRSKMGAALGNQAVVTVMDCPEVAVPVVASGSRFIVTTRGEDKPGTIFAITSFLKSNIIGWTALQLKDLRKDGRYVYDKVMLVVDRLQLRD